MNATRRSSRGRGDLALFPLGRCQSSGSSRSGAVCGDNQSADEPTPPRNRAGDLTHPSHNAAASERAEDAEAVGRRELLPRFP